LCRKKNLAWQGGTYKESPRVVVTRKRNLVENQPSLLCCWFHGNEFAILDASSLPRPSRVAFFSILNSGEKNVGHRARHKNHKVGHLSRRVMGVVDLPNGCL
jgi:hypothetical protein